MLRWFFVVSIVLLSLACEKKDPISADKPESTKLGKEKPEIPLQQLKGKILAMLNSTACVGASDCRYIALGKRVCGGPEKYLVYSVIDTDTEELKKQVKIYNKRREAELEESQAVGICVVEVKPRGLSCKQGRCVAR